MISPRDYWRGMNGGYLDNPHFSFHTRTFHESLAATTDMAVLPGILGCRPLRRTMQVRLGTNTLRSDAGGFMKCPG